MGQGLTAEELTHDGPWAAAADAWVHHLICAGCLQRPPKDDELCGACIRRLEQGGTLPPPL